MFWLALFVLWILAILWAVFRANWHGGFRP